jgi:vitamin B12/bleomycin/antimicrobial peptide transport system ATP-binding/permease protein
MARANKSDRERLLRFWSTASGFWRGRSALSSWPLSFALLAVAISQLAVQYRLNYWNRDFFNAIEVRDGARLWHQAALFVPLAFLSVSLSVSAVWARMTTQRKWREWVTTTVLGTWLGDERYRRLDSVEGEYKNAEYRISFDTRTATDAPIDLAFGFVSSALTALVFIDVLWTVGGGFTFAVGGMELTVPGYLVLGVGIYALIFSAAMLAIGRNLPSVIQTENQAEAELLAAANQIRESGKLPAAAAKEIAQKNLTWDALRQVLARWRQLCWQLMGTTLVSQTDLLFAPVFAWLLCAPKYLAGTMTLGELTQASAAFVTVQVAFNWLVDNYQRLSDWRSAAGRVATLLLALDKVLLLDAGTSTLHAENPNDGP